ncbi:MAG TPA: hypothetical protein VM010_02385, partial [Chitinophagaceae bacterium]|nr:hypothetical protein [Chitinophagaceae bacterium]
MHLTLGQKQFSIPSVKGFNYYKEVINAPHVQPEMGRIQLSTKQPLQMPLHGEVYWRYFQNSDSLTENKASVEILKTILLTRNGTSHPVTEGSTLHTGDTITVRLTVKSQRELQYINIKDRYAAAFKPLDAISGYQKKNGIGYFEKHNAASNTFLVPYLPKGISYLEYSISLTHAGIFYTGVATIQSDNDPDCIARSKNLRISIE